MNATERARRSDSLYYDTQVTNRRALCDMIANLESDLTESKAENAKLRERVAELEELEDGKRYIPQEWYQLVTTENAKLRDSLKALMIGMYTELCADRDEPDCKGCSMHHGEDECVAVDAMELLGIDMYGEPLGVKS